MNRESWRQFGLKYKEIQMMMMMMMIYKAFTILKRKKMKNKTLTRLKDCVNKLSNKNLSGR